jgi:hypothetical protein
MIENTGDIPWILGNVVLRIFHRKEKTCMGNNAYLRF